MPEYSFVDGLLEGNVSSWSEAAALGQTVTVRVVDVGVGESDELEADYAVTHVPEGHRPGLLRFVAARGRWAGDVGPVTRAS